MRRQQSQSIVFLTELLLSLTIFALCSSVCAGLFAWSHRLSEESGALSNAVLAAQSGAEAFKKNPAAESLAAVMQGTATGEGCLVYYDADWTPTSMENAAFVMRIGLGREAGLRLAEIVISDLKGAEIMRLGTTALLTEVKP